MDSEEARFAKRMRAFLGLFWLGALVFVAGFIAIFLLKPLGEHINVITALVCTGFGAMAIGNLGRVTCRCPKCNKLFCGDFQGNGGGYGNMFASSCRHCGFHTGRAL